jgi:hypothetical protein
MALFHLRGEAVGARSAGSPRPHCEFLTIYGSLQLYAPANCGTSELNAGDHGACYESPPEKPVESNRG